MSKTGEEKKHGQMDLILKVTTSTERNTVKENTSGQMVRVTKEAGARTK
jgi:hypothetical protein